ncbi:hypothetical protein K505DRAFT_369017 [Melanomma pulvis-pyrius CBS 109.77]|uniref:HMG box domain-containing protein n=1 Tax=Melanomma pulvis-pyrius CBS 109.77 TaxID=1314802 RepID=A0A6A6WNE5_9PLEO|nr:hypothetical protein K505DRAFT_369017 [Melanomma pulvis-pyrius CBS 109.77]
MSDLGVHLERLGLSQYLEALVAEGFDTWETVLDITESDLNSLNFKLGHRRKLQRSIAETRGQSADRPLLTKNTSGDGSYRSGDDSTSENKAKPSEPPAAGTPGTTNPSGKRKYRRHPKVDEHAPERPPSAYVIFSNQVRESLKGQEYSFTEIAKVVGERWQVLPADAREVCERQANAAKEKYYAELAEYKKTPQFDAYQKYLEEFKAKHGAPSKGVDGKRTKLETETSTSTSGGWNRSDEQVDRHPNTRVGSAQLDAFALGHHGTDLSPPIGPLRLPSGPSYPSTSTSPVARPLSRLNSPRMHDQYSPSSAVSPRSATLHKENSFDMHASAIARDARGQLESSLPYHPPAYPYPPQITSSTTPPGGYSSLYQAPIDLPSRRPFRELARLPPLTHEDTTLSSNSGDGGYNTTFPVSVLPVVDAQKSSRMLPQPVKSMGATPSPLDRHPLPVSSPQLQPDFRSNSSLAALLRAGELAREAHEEEMGKDGSP